MNLNKWKNRSGLTDVYPEAVLRWVGMEMGGERSSDMQSHGTRGKMAPQM